MQARCLRYLCSFWAADLFLSLSDPDMHIASATTSQVSYHRVDQGRTASLIYYDSDGGSYHPGGAQPAPFQLNVWYHNVVVYDPAAGTLSLRVTKVSDGSLVGEQELTGVGSFAGVDRLSISAVGHTYASGAIAEGYIDNLVLEKYSARPKRPIEILPLAGPLLRISWDSEAAREYQLWATSDLSSGQWIPVGPRMGGTGGKLYVDDYVEGAEQRFYRVERIQGEAD